VSSIFKCRSAGWAGARRLAVIAAGVTVTLAIGYLSMLAGTADGATRARLEVSAAAGPSWKIQRSPNPAGSVGTNLEGVSCTSAAACTAIGYYYRNAPQAIATLAEQWNGKTWTVHAGPSVTGLNAVSCTSARACTAVGDVLVRSGHVVTLAERWNGGSWTVQATPNPRGAGYSQLNGVSCTSATACTAVGYYYNDSSIFFPLAERWSGKSWTIRATPKPAGSTDPKLESVSCTSAVACTAVGFYVNRSSANQTLAERWNGKSWTIRATTNPGPENDYLEGVSCTSARACAAVGYQGLSSGQLVTLAERWNGASWTTQATPNPPTPGTSVLSGVSCASARACTAVGWYAESNPEPTGPFAERWNGATWTVQTTPSPAGTDWSPLNAVSCTAPGTCTAVGEEQDRSGTYLTLIEKEPS
jgi:hypothetical protein